MTKQCPHPGCTNQVLRSYRNRQTYCQEHSTPYFANIRRRQYVATLQQQPERLRDDIRDRFNRYSPFSPQI